VLNAHFHKLQLQKGQHTGVARASLRKTPRIAPDLQNLQFSR